MTYSEALLLCGTGICAVYLIGYACVRLWEKINESSSKGKFITLDEDLEAAITNEGENFMTFDWKSFQQQHIVTLNEHPNHTDWTASEWNDFLKKRNIYYDRQANSVISVQSEEDVLADFSSMILNDQFEMHSRNGKLYKSLQPRTVFQMTRTNDSTDDFCVYKQGEIHYLAIVEITNLGRKDGNVLFARTPVHLESRFNNKSFNVSNAERIP